LGWNIPVEIWLLGALGLLWDFILSTTRVH